MHLWTGTVFTGVWGLEYFNVSWDIGLANNSTMGGICILQRVWCGPSGFPAGKEDLGVLVNRGKVTVYRGEILSK